MRRPPLTPAPGNPSALRRGTLWAAIYGLACALLVIFAPARLKAQIQVTFEGANSNGSGNSTTIASFTVPSSGLPDGDTYFILGVVCGSGSGPNSTTTPCITTATGNLSWGGTGTGPWTKITNITSTNYRAAEMWQFKAPSGTGTLTVTANNAGVVAAGVWFVAGVSTTGPFGTPATTGGNGTQNPLNETLTNGANGLLANDLVLAVAAFGQSACPTCSASAAATGETLDWQKQAGSSSQNAWGLGGHAVATSTSQTMGFNTSGNENSAYAIAAVPIHPYVVKRKGQTIVARLEPIGSKVAPVTTGN